MQGDHNVIFARTSKLIIGRFYQLACGTKFILSDANHQRSGFSTYPFFIFGGMGKGCPEWNNYDVCLSNKGDTLIGNDVWFGHESIVMPAVRIGDGAIIAARTVVGKNVPPYTIVGGNSAQPIRRRFSDEVIDTLLKIQ